MIQLMEYNFHEFLREVLVIDFWRDGVTKFGEFILNDFGIYNMKIRNDLVKDLVTSTNSSHGVLREFNIVTNGKTYY
jgi:hypothetical protein